jgi:hypothetical protein
MPQLIGLVALFNASQTLHLVMATAALAICCAISAGIVYTNIGNWCGVPERVKNRRIAYTLVGGIPMLGPLTYLLIRP